MEKTGGVAGRLPSYSLLCLMLQTILVKRGLLEGFVKRDLLSGVY